MRSDLVEDRPGVPVELLIRLVNSYDCSALHGANVEIWSCDAGGEYAGFAAMSDGGPPGAEGMPHGAPHEGPLAAGAPPHMAPINQKTFLRGVQPTDGDGMVVFSTIFPGCYAGRLNHIHMKVRVPGRDGTSHVAHTGQIFFPAVITTAVLATDPYTANHVRRTLVGEDMVYNKQNGDQCLAHVVYTKDGDVRQGMRASITFSVDAKATPAPIGLS